MTKIFGRTLLLAGLLSCTSSSGGGGGGLTDANANQTAAIAFCSAAFNRCKGQPVGTALVSSFGNPTTEAECVTNVRNNDKDLTENPQGDVPCPKGQTIDVAKAQACLNHAAAGSCTDTTTFNNICNKTTICVTGSPTGAGGSPGGTGGSLGGGKGGSGPTGAGGSPPAGDACDMCLELQCGNEINGCFGNAACKRLFDCVLACGSNQTCVQTCVQQNQAGVAPLGALLECFENRCGAVCE
jgi:hypothetical protein